MCIYIYICIYILIYFTKTYIYICMYIYICTHFQTNKKETCFTYGLNVWHVSRTYIYTYIYTCIRTHTHIHTHTHSQRHTLTNMHDSFRTHIHLYVYINIHTKTYTHTHTHTSLIGHTGWRGLIGCLKLEVIFRKRATYYRAVLRKTTYEDKAFYDSTPPCITHMNVSILSASQTATTYAFDGSW